LAILAVKRAVHNRRAWHEDDVVAATPGLTPSDVEALAAYRRSLAARAAAEGAWGDAFHAELIAGRRAIVETIRDPLVSFGIALAGRSMITKIRSLDADDPAAWGHGERHVAAK